MRIPRLVPAALAAMVVACAAPAPKPVVAPQGEARYLVDPRTGWSGPSTPAAERALDAAWNAILAGDYNAARDRIASIQAKNADYAPATLANAAIAIDQQRYSDARTIVEPVLSRYPNYTAAAIYRAEIDVAEGQLRGAYERYRAISGGPPIVAERLASLQTRLFDQLYAAAANANAADAVRMLREALLINPSATAARVLLAQKLVAARNYDDARRELEPLVNSAQVDLPEVQESLAEIDIGKGRYQQAINRYERLTRRDTDGRYARRLSEVKQQFAEANMPPQFRRALEAEAITRADLAVLMYWKLTAIRFAQDVPAPPIAIDIGEVPQRDELIRVIALGIYSVDPVTRRVSPFTTVTASTLARIGARILAVRGASCARIGTDDPERILAACNVENPASVGVDMSVNGRSAATVLDQIERALGR